MIVLPDFDEVWLSQGDIILSNGNHWEDARTGDKGDGPFINARLLANRLCGTVFILTGDGESEGVRLRQQLPKCNFIYPQLRFRPQPNDPEFHTPYERDANRPAPFKMAMEQVTEDFRKTVTPYFADKEYSSEQFPPRLFWMNEEVYILLKMKF